MPPIWRWILAMGGSTFVLLAGYIVLIQGGAELATYGWFIMAIGAVSLLINLVMRKQFL
jgi:hypothetical protein